MEKGARISVRYFYSNSQEDVINQSIQMYGKVIARLEQEGHAVASVESEVKAETRFVETA
jgi:hypothetical protein